jgi:hypothetical protein
MAVTGGDSRNREKTQMPKTNTSFEAICSKFQREMNPNEMMEMTRGVEGINRGMAGVWRVQNCKY